MEQSENRKLQKEIKRGNDASKQVGCSSLTWRWKDLSKTFYIHLLYKPFFTDMITINTGFTWGSRVLKSKILFKFYPIKTQIRSQGPNSVRLVIFRMSQVTSSLVENILTWAWMCNYSSIVSNIFISYLNQTVEKCGESEDTGAIKKSLYCINRALRTNKHSSRVWSSKFTLL